jgi:hypothetical protein
MRRAVLLPVLLPPLLLAAAARAGEAPTARDIFRRAVAAQGELRGDQVKDVRIDFKGEISEEGPHTILRTYWYRAKDRSFRVRTASGVTDRLTTDRGVLGASDYWERVEGGSVVRLSPGNRDDAGSIGTIERERAEFERLLGMVLLARLDGDGWEIALGEPALVRLEHDEPFQLKDTLGDREKTAYHVLDATREGHPRLRLFVHTGDFTVRKAVEYDAEAPDRVRWVYYFTAYRKSPTANLALPQYLSVFRDTPSDARSRDELTKAKGLPTVHLNTGLGDRDLRPRDR